ncbi:hypothetical protein HD806DRAFT_475279 [Xylariaceae sp. AK1471]|nr:hypothetical protein HD806DRAFT_475279 [Xylariaceae sp. AK1471]
MGDSDYSRLDRPKTKLAFLLSTLPHVIHALQQPMYNSFQATLQSIQDHLTTLKDRINSDFLPINRRSNSERRLIILSRNLLDECEQLLSASTFKAVDSVVLEWKLLHELTRQENSRRQPIEFSLGHIRTRKETFDKIRIELDELSGSPPPEQQTSHNMSILESIRSGHSYVDDLVSGLEMALHCQCEGTNVHGALLFLDSHLESRYPDGLTHAFRLLVSEDVPDEANPSWLHVSAKMIKRDRDVRPVLHHAKDYTIPSYLTSTQRASATMSQGSQEAVLCNLMRSNSRHKDGFEVNIDRGDVTARPFSVPQDAELEKLRSCHRVGMKRLLSAAALLERVYTIKLALLFIVSSAILARTQLAKFGLSKEQVCFLQDDHYLYLQPFVFSWFPPARIIPPSANLGTTRDPILVGLSILLTEVFQRTTIDSYREPSDDEDRVIPSMHSDFYTVARVASHPDYATIWDGYEKYQRAVVDCVEASAHTQWTDASYSEFIVNRVFEPILEEYETAFTKHQPISWTVLKKDFAKHKIFRLWDNLGTSMFPVGRPLFDNFEEPYSRDATNPLISEMRSIFAKFDSRGIKTFAKIAVLDTGFDRNHPDFADSLHRISSRNFFDNNGEEEYCPDYDGHGTFITGLLVQLTGGKAGNTKLYIGKVFDAFTSLIHERSINALLKGIDWAIKEKVDAISLSFGYPEITPPLYNISDAIAKADREGIIVIAAAGNKRRQQGPAWPAKVKDLVLCANSADKEGNPSDFNPPTGGSNNFFVRTERIQSTWLREGYKIQSGTSWSAPALAAIAAVLIEYVDHFLSSHEVTETQRRHARALRTRSGVAAVFRELCSMPGPKASEDDKRYVVDARIAFDFSGGFENTYDNLAFIILSILARLQ